MQQQQYIVLPPLPIDAGRDTATVERSYQWLPSSTPVVIGPNQWPGRESEGLTHSFTGTSVGVSSLYRDGRAQVMDLTTTGTATPQQFVGNLASSSANDLIGYFQQFAPAVLACIMIPLGVGMMLSLFRFLVSKL